MTLAFRISVLVKLGYQTRESQVSFRSLLEKELKAARSFMGYSVQFDSILLAMNRLAIIPNKHHKEHEIIILQVKQAAITLNSSASQILIVILSTP